MKQVKSYKILSAGFSLLAISITGCKEGPKVTICVSDPAAHGFQCINADKSNFFLKYEDSDNYISFSPEDAETVYDYCASRK